MLLNSYRDRTVTWIYSATLNGVPSETIINTISILPWKYQKRAYIAHLQAVDIKGMLG